MSALFDQPVRATLDGKQVLIVGVVDDSYFDGEVTRADPKLLVNLGDGLLNVTDFTDVRTLWRYGVIPVGPRKGQTGWWDDIPEDEEPVNPIDVDDDGS